MPCVWHPNPFVFFHFYFSRLFLMSCRHWLRSTAPQSHRFSLARFPKYRGSITYKQLSLCSASFGNCSLNQERMACDNSFISCGIIYGDCPLLLPCLLSINSSSVIVLALLTEFI